MFKFFDSNKDKKNRQYEYELMKYKLTNDAIGIALWDMDIVAGDPVNANNAFTWSQEFRHMLGFDGEHDFPNVLHSWSDRIHPEDKERVLSAFEVHINDRTGTTHYDVECRLMLKNGDYRFFHDIGTTLRDSEGVPVRIAGALMDINEKKQMQNQLNIMSSIVHNSPSFVSCINLGGNCLYVNPAASVLTGYTEEELLKDYFSLLFDDETIKRITAKITEDFKENNISKYEVAGKIKSGEARVFEVTSFLVGNNSTANIGTDITEAKKIATDLMNATEKLRQREKMLNALNEMAIMLISHENESSDDVMGKGLQPVNDAAGIDRVAVYRLLKGNKFGQTYLWYGKTLPLEEELMILPDIPPIARWVGLAKKGECINGNVSEMAEDEVAFLSPIGVKSIFMVPIFTHGKFWGVITLEDHTNYRYFDEDLSDLLQSAAHLCAGTVVRAEIERELTEKNNLLATLNNISAVMIRPANGNFEENLYESMKILAEVVRIDRVCIWKNSTIAGKLHCTMIYEWAENDKFRQGGEYSINIPYSKNIPGWEETLSRGKLICSLIRDMSDAEQAQLSPHGVLSVLVTPVFLNNQFWGFVGFDDCRKERIFSQNEEAILRSAAQLWADAVVRTEMEREVAIAEAASRTKSVFVANMSHEIRTPMNSIIGFAELAGDEEVPKKTREYLSNISESAKWLLNIINDILDISKIESGKMELERIAFDLENIFVHCQSVIAPKAEEKGVRLYCYAEPSVGKKLMGDPVRLRQALMNLLSNAVKFTNVGTVKLMAVIKDSDNDSVRILFEVKDSGIGMSTEQMDKVFEPFVQGDDSVTRKFGGTGLGLAITKNIVELMGGSLGVESTVGVGSKFSFELTFGLTDDISEICSQKMIFNDCEKPDFEGEVLICEDNAMNRQVICEHLARVGLRTVTAHNGKEGVDIVAERKKNGEKAFDLIFMDIHMPVMDGLEAAVRMAELEIETPVIALTANIMANDLELYRANGMTDYLGKPFTSQELWKCLIRYIPVGGYAVSDRHSQSEEEAGIQKRLKMNFAKENQSRYREITEAAESGDAKLAHRLAHTLKSNAGQIGQKALQASAAAVEATFAKGSIAEESEMKRLESDLRLALEELAPLLSESESSNKPEIVDAGKIRELFGRLEPLLIARDTDCLFLLDDLRAIPGTHDLVRLIDDFDFSPALKQLYTLMEGMFKFTIQT